MECNRERKRSRFPTFTSNPAQLIVAVRRAIDRSKLARDEIVKRVLPEYACFCNVIQPLAEDENNLLLVSHPLDLYQVIASNKQLRDASMHAARLLNDFVAQSYMRDDLFLLVEIVFNNQKDDSTLDSESRMLLANEYERFIEAGSKVPKGKTRDLYHNINQRLSRLTSEFQSYLVDCNHTFFLDDRDLFDFPAHLRDMITMVGSAASKNAKHQMVLRDEDVFAVLQTCKSERLRRRLFLAYENRYPDNVSRLNEIIHLRNERAHLLGYSSHAALQIGKSMATTPTAVTAFLTKLRSSLTPQARDEVSELNERKKHATGEDKPYFWWDHLLYSAMGQSLGCDTDPSEYFPLDIVLPRMLAMFGRLLDLDCEEIDVVEPSHRVHKPILEHSQTWHPDVRIFSCQDRNGPIIGRIYLDLYSRDGKYNGSANRNIEPGFTRRNGVRHLPSTAVCCNFDKPLFPRPHLLSHGQLVIISHEVGHALHDIVSRTKYSRFHGTSGARDFVEMPSQLFENWCWQPEILQRLAMHWSYMSPRYKCLWEHTRSLEQRPPKGMPASLIEAIVGRRHHHQALTTLDEIRLSLLDLTLHDGYSVDKFDAFSCTELNNQLMEQVLSPIQGPQDQGKGYRWGHGQAAFGHIVSGYDAGYYGYLWSQMYSDDIFDAVFKQGLDDVESGRAFRRCVLERGSAGQGLCMLKDFLGREPSTAPFYAKHGILDG